MGAKTSVPTGKQSSKQQSTRSANPNEKKKDVQSKEIVTGNPERDVPSLRFRLIIVLLLIHLLKISQL